MGIFHITPMHGNRKPLKMHALAAPGNRVFLIVFFVLLPCILWSCAGQQKSVQKASPQDQSKATAKGELKELVLPQKGETGAKPQRLYTLQMRDAEVQDLLLAFSRDTNLNVVVDPKVSGRVTVDLKGVTLEQVLEVICSQLGVEYRREKNIITIYKPSLETRIFPLDYITTVRKGKSFATGGIGGRSSGGTTSGGAGGSGASGQSISGGYSEVSTEDESDLWKEIEKGLQSLKSTDGSVIVHKSSNTVLVKDYPAYLQRIAGYLNSVTGSVQRQVLIETQIIEVSLNDTFQAGIDWQTIQNLPQMSNLSWGLAGKNGQSPWVGYPGSTGGSGGSSGGGSSSGTTQEIPGKFFIRPYGGVFRIGAPDQNIPLSDIVDALSTQGNVNILSSPRISTLNNQPAIIKVAREEPYFQTTRSTVTGETNTTTEVNFLTIGIVLAVTPQISADGTITLTIHPSITERAGERVSAQGDVVPIVDVRETDTVVRVNDRETILIAGLMQNKIFEDINGIPLLCDIPLIGRLFTHISRETKKTELVVMLTPRVITSENVKELSSPEIKGVDELRRDNFKNSK